MAGKLAIYMYGKNLSDPADPQVVWTIKNILHNNGKKVWYGILQYVKFLHAVIRRACLLCT